MDHGEALAQAYQTYIRMKMVKTMLTIDTNETDSDVLGLPPQQFGQDRAPQLQLLESRPPTSTTLAKSLSEALRETMKCLEPRFG